jgi:hypothetical protein
VVARAGPLGALVIVVVFWLPRSLYLPLCIVLLNAATALSCASPPLACPPAYPPSCLPAWLLLTAAESAALA